MSVMCCMLRATKINSVIRISLTKVGGKAFGWISKRLVHKYENSGPSLIWQKVLTGSGSTYIDKHGAFMLPNRTLIRKRQLIGTDSSSHLKPDYKKDKVGPEYEFIYCSSNISLYYWCTPVLFVMIIIGFAISGKVIVDSHWYGKEMEDVELSRLYLDSIDPLTTAYTISFIMMGFLVLALRYLRTVLLRLYYNKSTNEFVAVLLKYGIYRKKLYFKPSDVERIEKFRLQGNVIIKGIPLTVSESSFVNTLAYNIFMGYSPSRPSEYQEILDKENIKKTLEIVKNRIEKEQNRIEKKHNEEFVEKYEKKRKQKQLKGR